MALDEQVRVLLDQLAAAAPAPLDEQTPEEARQWAEVGFPMMAGAGAQDVSVSDVEIPGPSGSIPARIYTPVSGSGWPVLVFYHGGGWVIGSIETHDATCRDLASASGAAVLSVGYRLAPEHPFPAAVDDAWAALQWVATHATELGVDGDRIAVGGDSAGGNLAAVVAQLARDRHGPVLRLQLLVYPATDLAEKRPSVKENSEGLLLTEADMDWFGLQYLGAAGDPADPLASPMRAADLSGLAPAHVITCEFDPLRDDGQEYAARLKAAGVPVTSRCYDGMIHGALGLQAVVDASSAIIRDAAEVLRGALSA